MLDVSDHEGMHEISSEERQEILGSIEETLTMGQRGPNDETPSIHSDLGLQAASKKTGPTAQKRSTLLPIWMNVGALLLVGLSSFAIWKFLGTKRDSESPASAGIASTEGLIVEQLREETQAELNAKNRELEEIREQLEAVESARLKVEEEIEGRLAIREGELLTEFREGLEDERRRLIAAGISGDQLKRDMDDYETAAQEEIKMRLSETRVQLDNEYKRRISELNARRGLYEAQIKDHDVELKRLAAEVANLESEIQSLAGSEVLEARRALEELQARKEGEEGIRTQIAAYYKRVSDNWGEGNFTAAIEMLDALDSYLDEPGIRESEVVRRNRSVNSFLITALRRLVSPEETVNDVGAILLEEEVFGPEDLEQARNEALAEAAEEKRILEERRSAFLRALDALRNDYAASYNTVLESNSGSSAGITTLLSDKLRIKSDLEPSAHALFDTFIESANVLEINKVRGQMYEDFLGAIDELILELEAVSAGLDRN